MLSTLVGIVRMIAKQEAIALFAPIKRDLVKVILESWKAIHSSDLNFKSRSRACLMWDETLHRAKIAFAADDGISYIQELNEQTAHYWLNPKTFFRIKKSDEKGYTRNYPTQTALEFHDEESDLFGPASRLEVTYVLSKDEAMIEDIAVVQRVGNAIDFKFSLLDEANVITIAEDNAAESTETYVTTVNVAKLKTSILSDPDESEGNE